jgi:hemoglobin/transferrin/lactoferrin receptor protein
MTHLAAAVQAALALAALSAALLPASAAWAQSAQQTQARGYRIPAGTLAEALPRFADSAGVTVLFDAALVGQRRPPRRGSMGSIP